MGELPRSAQAIPPVEEYRALLAVSEAIVSHRDLRALFHELAGRLHEVVRFDYLALHLHEAASNVLRMHVLEAFEPTPNLPALSFPVGESPAGLAWQTQQPHITSNVAEQRRWPGHLERTQSYEVQSACDLPLTTARRRLGILAFACKQPSAYDAADVQKRDSGTGPCPASCPLWGRKESGSGLLTVSDPGLIFPESACR